VTIEQRSDGGDGGWVSPENFERAKQAIYSEGMREGCEELMLEAAKLADERDALKAALEYAQGGQYVAVMQENERLRKLTDYLRAGEVDIDDQERQFSSLQAEVERLRADIKTYEASEKADHAEVERLRKKADWGDRQVEVVQELEAEVERLRAANGVLGQQLSRAFDEVERLRKLDIRRVKELKWQDEELKRLRKHLELTEHIDLHEESGRLQAALKDVAEHPDIEVHDDGRWHCELSTDHLRDHARQALEEEK